MAVTANRARKSRGPIGVAAIMLVSLAIGMSVLANVALIQLSADPFSNATSQHRTEVEPDTFSFGSTIVAAFQVGRFFDGGSSGIGWATSLDGGATWTKGFLPGITKFQSGGPYDRVSDPAVAYDAKHNVWLISSLALIEVPSVHGEAVLTSRSTDVGISWGNPVWVANVPNGDLDKNWIVCDTTPSSPFYGNCYTQWDDHGDNNRIKMSRSIDGGLTWGPAKNTADNATGLGGQPVVQPNGTVVVPLSNAHETAILAFKSTDGGTSWSRVITVSVVQDHAVAGGLRTGPLPSAEVDGAGKVYVVWQDCRFRSGCKSNDIVMSTSTNGTTWFPVVRIPIHPVTSPVDHFIPGLAVDKSTIGTNAHLGLTYYYYPSASCSPQTCQLNVGYVSSADGGAHWSSPIQLAGPMMLSWLPNTNQGRMVGDYISTSFADGKAYPAFAVARVPTAGGTNCAKATPNCAQAVYAPGSGLSALAAATHLLVRAGAETPVPAAASDHPTPPVSLTRR
jgi:hypothetical protein